jgi:hypothetical protein
LRFLQLIIREAPFFLFGSILDNIGSFQSHPSILCKNSQVLMSFLLNGI